MPFENRADAGRQLAKALERYKGPDTVVLALPRGGIPVAAEIAARLGAPLDLILVRKIGVPFQPELAMGAVVDGDTPLVVRNKDVILLSGVDEAKFQTICDHELAEIERRRKVYLGHRPRAEIKEKIAIVVDDGIATGATMRAALQSTRRHHPKTLVLAVPVAPSSTLEHLRHEVDELVCLEDYEPFNAIGLYYADFRQLTDHDVIDLLNRRATGVDAKLPE